MKSYINLDIFNLFVMKSKYRSISFENYIKLYISKTEIEKRVNIDIILFLWKQRNNNIKFSFEKENIKTYINKKNVDYVENEILDMDLEHGLDIFITDEKIYFNETIFKELLLNYNDYKINESIFLYENALISYNNYIKQKKNKFLFRNLFYKIRYFV